MHGARWGWVALVAAITVLFVASSESQTGNKKMANLLRQELKTTHAEQERLVVERDRVLEERNEAHEAIGTIQEWAQEVDQELVRTRQELLAMKAERDKLRKELTSLSQDRNQLQQTVASLQIERSQTRRSVDQLKQGLQQLLSQTETVASTLAGPAPGFAQTNFDETPAPLLPAQKSPCSEGTYFADEPLNDNQ